MTDEVKKKIRGALACGYCHPMNDNKLVDPDLIEAMIEELEKLNFEFTNKELICKLD